MLTLCLSILQVVPTSLYSQGVPIGQWRHHLPNNTIISIAEKPGQIVGANPYGLIFYNKNDNSVERFNKVHGLSDFGISQVVYVSGSDLLFIAYENGNIDIKQNSTVYNIPDIKRAPIIGSKSINSVVIEDNTAYLATGFGIVKLNLSDFTVRDTYYIGPDGSQINVNDLLFTEQYIYAATEGGIFRADVDAPNLADFNYWNRLEDTPVVSGNYNLITVFAGHIFTSLAVEGSEQPGDTIYYKNNGQWEVFAPEGEDYFYTIRQLREDRGKLLVVTQSFVDVFNDDLERIMHIDDYYDGVPNPYDAIIDYQDFLWIGDNYHGMVKMTSAQSSNKIMLRGPSSANSFALAASKGNIWVAPGSNQNWQNHWNYDGFFRFFNERWGRYSRFGYEEMEGVFDIVHVAVNPRNPNHVAISSWISGVLVFNDYELEGLYDEANSTLQPRVGPFDRVWISSTAFDRQGNLWVANARTEEPLSVKRPNGEWLSFDLNGLVSSEWVTGEIIIDDYDQKWMILPEGNGVIVFRENTLNNNNDYEVRRLTTAEGSGRLPSNHVTAIAKDHNGYVWVATNQGVVVFYSPQRALTGEPFNAQPIILEEDGFAGLLFENETINSITVDGSNKKWFGTARAGAFLMAADGRETIHRFNADNSPLPSDNVRDIAVEPETGEVFFATEKGIASFRGFATEGAEKHTDVFAFPNPVKPGYNGYIAVNGLVRNANVKITDINGNLVYETVAEGGQAVWNGRDIRGNRPASGVYLVYSTNEDGSETIVTKILFLN